MISSALTFASAHIQGPHIAWGPLTTVGVLALGAIVVLLAGLHPASQKEGARLLPALTIVTLLAAITVDIWHFGQSQLIIAGALRVDDLALITDMVCAFSGITAVLVAFRSAGPRHAGAGEFHSLLLFSIMGMAILAAAADTITLFIGIELLSIPLYVLCASEYRRSRSLESGLKYLIIGSIGSATLLYGLALIYGATGKTSFGGIAQVLAGGTGRNLLSNTLLLFGMGLVLVGFAFKASIAPFHQWTPDVYEGAPTPVTLLMVTATKAAALVAILRFSAVAVISAQSKWSPMLAVLAAITMIVGNVGALGQTSLKRMLGYSGVAQAGYMLTGVVVGTRLGASATVFYIVAYVLMNIAAFAVIQHIEQSTGEDRVGGLRTLSKRSPALAWSLTISMLALGGFPGTVGFIGKFQLIRALVDGNHAWLAVVLVIGAVISLGYYLRVVAAIWMPARDRVRTETGEQLAPIAGGSPELDLTPRVPILLVAVVTAAACVVLGVAPQPLFHFAAHAGAALTSLIP